MLILARKLNEKIHISGGITITVVDIDRGKIRLGIDAPKGVLIHRDELREHFEKPAVATHDLGGES